MSIAAELNDIAGERFVQLTTFRRSGEPVATPVWIAVDASGVPIITTVDGSGKVKRLRHTSRVLLRPCDRRGRVADSAPTVPAEAAIIDDPSRVSALAKRFLAKYGLEYRVFMAVERVVARGQRPRVILRLTSGPRGPA